MNVTELMDLKAPPALERLLAQTHAGSDALQAELDSERARLEDFACRAGLRPDLVRRFVAVGLLASATEGAEPPSGLSRMHDAVAVGLLLDVLERLDALRSELMPRQVSLWT